MSLLRWHWWSEVLQVIFSLLHLQLDLSCNVWQAMLDVREKDLGQLLGQVVDTQ